MTLFCLEKIASQCSEQITGAGSRKVQPSFCFEVRKAVSFFVGRVQELRSLESFLDSKKDLLVISGLGGQGKTQLCRKFLNSITEKGGIGVVWLQGENLIT